MTNIGDVIRQVETALCDTCFPPPCEERKILTTILSKVYTDTVDFGGRR